MKRLFNNPGLVVEELVEGLVALQPGLRKIPGQTVVVRSDIEAVRPRQVALISGGGSGHEPAHAGYVGRGMLSAAVAGEVFTSPSPDAVLAAIRAVAGPPGVLLIVKNYTGDRLNFGIAAEMARVEGIAVETVIVADDVALGAAAGTAGPRGLAGTILVHKVAGAAAEEGRTLGEVAALARETAGSARTMGVALSACTVPAVGKPGFILPDNEVELGLGIHGEPGVRRAPLEPADALVDQLLATILDRPPTAHRRVVLLVNGLGGTTAMELAIVARHALKVLAERGILVERAYAGTFLSALEMAGVSLTVLEVDDARLARLDASTDAPAWPNAPPRTRVEPEPEPERIEPDATPEPVTTSPPITPVGKAIEAAIRAVADALIAAEPQLTELDQAVGDGDLGLSLARGASALLEALPTLPLDDPPGTLETLARTLQRTLGGTSGPLYGILLLRASRTLRANPTAWADAFTAGVAGIAELGQASRGDRTMLDALLPAAEAFERTAKSGHVSEALEAAALAAQAGAEATANLPPRRGRSSYLGDRALGHPDPGAVAVALWLRALATSVGSKV